MLDLIGTLGAAAIGAGASLFGLSKEEKVADKQLLYQMQLAKRQEKLQKEFAQHGVAWRVKDAERSGIHPLAALGANVTSYGPVSVGNPHVPDYSEYSQQIGSYAKDALGKFLEYKMQNEQIRNVTLHNELLKKQIEDSGVAVNPDGTVKVNIDEAEYVDPISNRIVKFKNPLPDVDFQKKQMNMSMSPGYEAGIAPLEGYKRHGDYLIPLLTQESAESLESDLFGSIKLFGMRLKDAYDYVMYYKFPYGKDAAMMRQVIRKMRPPDRYCGPGEYWAFNPWIGGFRLMKVRKDGKKYLYVGGSKKFGYYKDKE